MKQTIGALPAALVLGLAIAAAPTGSIPAEAAQIKSSPVCKAGISFCINFTNTGAIPLVASFTFNAPTAGTAMVSFNGSMQCVNNNSSPFGDAAVVDLTTQILANAALNPNYQGPGGSRFAMRLTPANRVVTDPPLFDIIDKSVAINLASNRVMQVTPGPHTVVFKIARNRMDSGTSCGVFNGDFNVVLVP